MKADIKHVGSIIRDYTSDCLEYLTWEYNKIDDCQ